MTRAELRRPDGRSNDLPGAAGVIFNDDGLVTMTPTEFAYAYEVSRQIGWQASARQFIEDSRAIAGDAQPIWRHPNFVDLERRRTYSPDACAQRCGACSRCVHTEALAARGGKSFGGVAPTSRRDGTQS